MQKVKNNTCIYASLDLSDWIISYVIVLTPAESQSVVLSTCLCILTTCSGHWERFGSHVNLKDRFLPGDLTHPSHEIR